MSIKDFDKIKELLRECLLIIRTSQDVSPLDTMSYNIPIICRGCKSIIDELENKL